MTPLAQKPKSMFSLPNMPSTTSVLSTYTTFAASAMLVRTMLNEVQTLTNQLLPQQLRQKIQSMIGDPFGKLSSDMTLIINEYNGYCPNEVYQAAELYLGSIVNYSVKRLKVYKASQEKSLSTSIYNGETVLDFFEEIQLKWELVCTENQKNVVSYEDSSITSEKSEYRSYELSFNKKHIERVLDSYLPYVLERSEALKNNNRVLKLHSLHCGGYWNSTSLNHPSTFDTLAIDPELKKELIADLDRFMKRREFYRRVGRAWKRGYLLYGPPGTGKSSLVAAMANYLKFDIYDLELTSLRSNSDLTTLLTSTTNRSILVIEDIDCSIDLQNRENGNYMHSDNQLTLSGLLNFIDGLRSSCGDERIIVFTTNHKDKLDPALLRPGRMDMHIHMSYCTPCGFKILARNYLNINTHSLFKEIEELMLEVEVTPAEVAEELLRGDNADVVLAGLLKHLQKKKMESQNPNAKEEKQTGDEGGKNDIAYPEIGHETEKAALK